MKESDQEQQCQGAVVPNWEAIWFHAGLCHLSPEDLNIHIIVTKSRIMGHSFWAVLLMDLHSLKITRAFGLLFDRWKANRLDLP